ncbi:DOPA-like domain-containing protein [Polychytrium aggregatum]|uniref:DOPA-like domain-containing protein n=1 Tax=Polychytrium aggregatum TaxID=110093 RepID=UPI0022FDBE87|nr:DOPA-like domain-containing protein [Polychytrium aggregatum]KAI9209905.1 DOPA-like domain-containing protein [Polychytrium aggregatum]
MPIPESVELSRAQHPVAGYFINPQQDSPSKYYNEFPEPVLPRSRSNAWDAHVYFDANEAELAQKLHDKFRREFPELRIYTIWDRPIGPHSKNMFELQIDTPAQFGAVVPWLNFNRGNLSVLVHPKTSDGGKADHTRHAFWLGEKLPVKLAIFDQL